jgi:hypothetical protein
MDTATIRSGYANYWHDDPISPNNPVLRMKYEEFDRWLAGEKAKVWDKAYQAGAFDTLGSPAEATENPYRSES